MHYLCVKITQIMNTNTPDKKYCYRYPHPAVTVDCVVFGFDGNALKILLIERGIEPYKGMWALPGGFMKMDETVEQAAARELEEETNLTGVYLQQFKVFSDVNRDPRERVITVSFISLLRPEDCELVAGDDATNALWFDEHFLPPMAFDHTEIIKQARKFLSDRLKLEPVVFQLLNRRFSLGELQKVYEVINRKTYDRRNFQRKALQSGILEETTTESDNSMTPMPQRQAPSTHSDRARPSGRPTSKLFSFKTLFTKSSDDMDESDEGSTKDLFDF